MSIDQVSLSRRRLLAGASMAAAASFVGGASSVMAKAPMQNTQAPAVYQFKVGAIEATVVSDGPLAMGEPKDGVFIGLSKEQLTKALTDNFLPTDNVVLEQNALVINTGDGVVLFDTGMNCLPGLSKTRLTPAVSFRRCWRGCRSSIDPVWWRHWLRWWTSRSCPPPPCERSSTATIERTHGSCGRRGANSTDIPCSSIVRCSSCCAAPIQLRGPSQSFERTRRRKGMWRSVMMERSPISTRWRNTSERSGSLTATLASGGTKGRSI